MGDSMPNRGLLLTPCDLHAHGTHPPLPRHIRLRNVRLQLQPGLAQPGHCHAYLDRRECLLGAAKPPPRGYDASCGAPCCLCAGSCRLTQRRPQRSLGITWFVRYSVSCRWQMGASGDTAASGVGVRVRAGVASGGGAGSPCDIIRGAARGPIDHSRRSTRTLPVACGDRSTALQAPASRSLH